MISKTTKKINKIYSQVDKIATKGKDYVLDYYKLIDTIIKNGDYGYLEQCLNYFYKIDITEYPSIDEVKKKTWPEIRFQTSGSLSKKIYKLYNEKKVYQTGYDFYSSNTSTLGATTSYGITSTYSTVSPKQSSPITFGLTNSIFYLYNTQEGLYRSQIFKTEWTIRNGVDTPSNFQLVDDISILSATYSHTTNISINPGTYLLRTYELANNKVVNYKLSILYNNYLGQIKEIEEYTQDPKYLIENKELAKLLGEKKSYLEVIIGTSSTIIDEDDPSLSEDQNLLNRYSIAIDLLNT